jgi:hypothetical protein
MNARMDSRIPSSLQPMLRDLLSRLERDLPGLLEGFYLYGSIAYGAWDEAASDIDCLAVVTRPCSPEDLSRLRLIHQQITARWPRCDLEISYVQRQDCGPRAAGSQPLYREGQFHDRSYSVLNSPLWSSILWWQIKKRGIALLGPEAAELDFQVSEAGLLEDNRRLVETYWIEWSRSPSHILKLRYRRAVDWVVLGILRTYYTLREVDVTTKPGAAEYGIAQLPARWHRLIRETVEMRRRPVDGGILFRLRRAIEAALFTRFMVAECRRAYAATRPPGHPD